MSGNNVKEILYLKNNKIYRYSFSKWKMTGIYKFPKQIIKMLFGKYKLLVIVEQDFNDFK